MREGQLLGARPAAGVLDPTQLPRGTRIGYYEVVERVGAGGFGTLYKAARGKGTFAVKLSTKALREMEADERTETERRVGREVSALHALRHPNVVRVHAHELWPDEDGYPYIVMDFVDGYRLVDWRKKLRPSLRLCCQVVSKIALALERMHRLGVFHRDLKSENVLVKKDGEPVIVDFGIARPMASESVTRAQTWLGTPRYLAPEYVKYWDTSDFAKGVPFRWAPTTDLYAVGVTLYELVTGSLPVKRGSKVDVLLAIKYTTPEPPARLNPKVPESLSGIVMRLLEKDPGKRVQSGQELFDLLVAAGAAASGHVPAWDEPLEVPGDSPGAAPANGAAPQEAAPPEEVLPGTMAARGKVGSPASAPDGEESEESYVATRNLVAAAAAVGMALPAGGAGGDEARAVGKLDNEAKPGPPVPATGDRAAAADGRPQPFDEPTQAKVAPLPSELLSSELRASPGEGAAAGGAQKRDSSSELHREVAALAGAGEGKRSRRWPLFLGGVVLALVILILSLASTGRNKAEGPSSLLARVQQAEAALDAGVDLGASELEAATPSGRPSPLQGVDGVQANAPSGQPPVDSAERPSLPKTVASASESAGGRRMVLHRDLASINSDEAEIRRLEEDAYSATGARPTVPGPVDKPDGKPGRKNARSDAPPWLHVAERVDAPAAPAATLGIPLGAHVRAKLLTNLDSKTVGDGFVEARLARPFVTQGEVKLPTGTLAYGKGTSTQGRFDIHFTRMVLPGGKELALDGLAYDVEEKKAGLKASRGATTPKPKQDSKPSRILKDTGQVLAGAIGQGDIATEAAQRAAQETLSDDTQGSATSEATAYLDAGADLDIFLVSSL